MRYDASLCGSFLWACLMKKILILLFLSLSVKSYAFSIYANGWYSSISEALIAKGEPYQFCQHKKASYKAGTSPGYLSKTGCTWDDGMTPPYTIRVEIFDDSCPEGSSLDKSIGGCVADVEDTCEILKGKVLTGQYASYCMSSGQPRYYINKCDVLSSDGSVIIAPPDANPSIGYFGDWVITGKPRSACIPDPDPNEDNKGDEGDDKGEQGGDDNGGDTGSNEDGGNDGETGGGSGGGGSGGSGGTGGGSGGGGSGNGEGGSGNGNGEGEGGNGDGGGTGSEGGGTGGGGSGGSGNGDGDGEDDKPSAGGLPCNQALICKGDAVQCAQLEKQKQIQCAQEDLYRMDSEIKTDLQQQVNKNTQEVEGFGDKDGPVTNIGNLISKGSGWLPRSCPAPMHVNVYGQDLEFSYSNTCKLASDLSGLIVALFSFLAIRVFARQG